MLKEGVYVPESPEEMVHVLSKWVDDFNGWKSITGLWVCDDAQKERVKYFLKMACDTLKARRFSKETIGMQDLMNAIYKLTDTARIWVLEAMRDYKYKESGPASNIIDRRLDDYKELISALNTVHISALKLQHSFYGCNEEYKNFADYYNERQNVLHETGKDPADAFTTGFWECEKDEKADGRAES